MMNKKIIALCFSYSLMFAKYYDEIPKGNFASTTRGPIENLSSSQILQLYQIMKDVHDVFTKYDIPYWVDGGTLLGAIRHKGQMPWDDDLDIDMPKEYEKLFLSLKPVFNRMNYDFAPVFFGYKIFPMNGRPIPGYNFKVPALDVFLVYTKNDAYFFTNWPYQGRNGKPFYMTFNEVHPIKEYTFGQITVKGPGNPESVLIAYFGKDWFEKAVKTNHSNPKVKETILLTPEDRVPAQPTGPLVNTIDLLTTMS